MSIFNQENVDIRSKQLMDLGLIFNGKEFILEDFNVHWTELVADNDDVFNKKIDSIKKEMIRRLK